MKSKIKKNLLIILPFLMCISCTPKKVVENDLEEMGLKGRVKILKIDNYVVGYKFGVLVKREQRANMHPNLPEQYYVFNKEGKIIEKFRQYLDYEEKTVNAYDDQGNLIQENVLDNKKGEYAKHYTKYTNKYDINNNLIETTSYQGDSILERIITSYSKNGDKLVKTKYSGDGEHKETDEYQYNFWGYYTKYKIPWYGYIREYNKYGKHIRYIDYNGYKVTNEYDQNGNISNYISSGGNNGLYHVNFQYNYDTCNNFVKKSTFTKWNKATNFDPGSVEIREISYFNDGNNIADQESPNGIKRDRLNLFPTGWRVVAIPNVGSIAIPPDMEIRDDSALISKKSADFRNSFAANKNIEIEKPLLLIQPKGINNQTKNASENYARIIINVTNGQKGDFPKNDSELNDIDLSELNSIRKEQTQFFVKKFGSKIINWNPPRSFKINDFNIIELKYVRAIVSTNKESYPKEYSFLKEFWHKGEEDRWDKRTYYKSIVKVSDFTVFNDNKMINIVISYRLPENMENVDLTFIFPRGTTKQHLDLDFLINTLDFQL